MSGFEHFAVTVPEAALVALQALLDNGQINDDPESNGFPVPGIAG